MDATIGSERGRTVMTPGVAMQFGTNDQHKGPSLFRPQKTPFFFFFFLFSHRKTFRHAVATGANTSGQMMFKSRQGQPTSSAA